MLKFGRLIQVVRCGVAIATLFALGSTFSSAQNLTVIRAAAIADDDATTILYAVRSGAFRRAGLDVQFQALSSGSAIAAAVIGGSVDVGKSGTVTLVNAHDHNVPITIIAAASIYDTKDSISELVVASDSPVHSAKDLNGHTVSVGSLKGLEQICISGWVDNNGGDSKTLHFLDMPLNAMRAALDTHRVETAMMTYPALADALASGKVRILGHATDGIAPHFLGTAWFASIDWARAHSEAVAAFSRVMRETAIYVNAHPADTVALIAELTGVSAARIAEMPRNTPGTVLNASDLQPVINAAAKYGTIGKAFPGIRTDLRAHDALMAKRRMRFGRNDFELGVFSFNVHNGMAQIKAETWDNSFEHNLEVAKAADEAGIEFLLPLGRWQGLRSPEVERDDEGGSYETLVWAAGILAATKRIAVFGTLHVAYVNPVFAAKQIVTAHHIGRGRFGLNVVSGTVARDFAMFGLTPGDHDSQYDYTEEWVTVMKRVLSETAPFDYDGTYFNLEQVLLKPKPYGGKLPMLISAGHSHRGRAFAMQHADALFTSLTELENVEEELRMARAANPGGERVPIYASTHVVCRPTRKEADEYYHHLVYELGDWDGIEEQVAKRMRNRTMPFAKAERLKERLISGMGTFLVHGSYDDVAQTYKQLHDAGLDGLAVGFTDYLADFAAFREEVLPRLERLGLRQPQTVTNER